jgi:hypothetical protein
MAYFVAGDGGDRDLRDAHSGYRFGRAQAKRFRARTTLSRVSGYLKDAIKAIANSKIRRMQRELELRGIRFDEPDHH